VRLAATPRVPIVPLCARQDRPGESVEHFQKFMANPDLQAFIGSVGGAPEPPEVIVAEAISSLDEF
jgi:hypothetical protein